MKEKIHIGVNALMLKKKQVVQYFWTHRSKGAPWPPEQSISVDGHNAAAYLANPGLQGSPSADSLAAQSAPSAFAFA